MQQRTISAKARSAAAKTGLLPMMLMRGGKV